MSSSATLSLDASTTSHFISLDSSGKAIIWVATQASGVLSSTSADAGTDYGLSPWGKMKLIRQRVLYGATSHPYDTLGTYPNRIIN